MPNQPVMQAMLQARDAVEHVVPAAVERDALGGNPRGAEGAEALSKSLTTAMRMLMAR